MKKFKRFNDRFKPIKPKSNDSPSGRCVVGIHGVHELIKVRARAIDQLWMREGYASNTALKTLADEARRFNVKVTDKPVGVMDKIVLNHQGVLAFTQESPEIDWFKLKSQEHAVLIALDEVEDPHNLGAVLRTCWLFGAQGVLTPEVRSAPLSPAVSKVAQGAVEHVPVMRDSALPEQLKSLKDQGFWILGLSHKAKQSLYDLKIPEKVVWVLGSEDSGLRKSTESACDDLISIPQAAPEASYNVSVAAAVALAETYRQGRI